MRGYSPIITKGGDVPYMNNRMKVKEESGKPKSTLAERYKTLSAKRETQLSRAKMYAKITLPALFSEDQSTDQGDAYTQNSWQSLGAQGVNHLANKLVMTWFPPQRSFFKLEFTDEAKQALYDAGTSDVDLLSIMARAENKARLLHEQIQGRIAWTQAAKHLIVAGNAMLYAPLNDSLVCYPMDKYVVKRSKTGRVTHMILEEVKCLSEFPPAVQAIIKAKRFNLKQDDTVELYTQAKWDGSMYVITQEAVDTTIGKEYRVKPEESPFIVLTWERLYGEDYGRGLVESCYGDLFTYAFLSKAVAKGCALMSEVKFLVKRGSATSPTAHAKAETGDYVWGEVGDVSVVQLEKYGDYQTVLSVLETYSKRLGQAFLLASANRRDAERVTTYELRMDAMELETSLGGTYSQIAVSGQLPYANLLLKRSGFKLPATDAVPIIITGIEALGKAGELDKLMQLSEMMAIPNSWSPAAQERIKWSDYIAFIAANLNMETSWLMTEDEYNKMKQAQQQQMQQQQLMEAAGKAAPQMMKQ